MSPHKSGLVQASLPLVFGFIGIVKLGRLHLGVFVLVAALAAFAYRSGYHRAKYGTAPTKIALVRQQPGKVAGPLTCPSPSRRFHQCATHKCAGNDLEGSWYYGGSMFSGLRNPFRMARFRLLAFALLCLPSCTVSAASDRDLVTVSPLDEQSVRDAILQRVKTSIESNDFAGLSAMESDFRSSRARTPSGLWKLAVFHAGVQAYLAPGLQQENGCKYQKQQFLRQWSAASPTNPAPVITDASLLLKQAWCVRGPGYAGDVEESAWPQFRISVAAASRALAEHSAMASGDPEYYAVKLEALRSEGAGLDATQALLEEATQREPYYHRTYFNAAWSYLPQWGGSFAEVERLARYAADKTRTLEHDGFYARVFWSLEDCGCHIMDQAADRTMLKQAMRDVYNLYPVRWNGQYNADISCQLGEVEEGRRYLRALHPEATGEGDFVGLFASCDQARSSS